MENDMEHDGKKRRNVRPNFAEDVYGDKKLTTPEEIVYSESSLAQRRSALLIKLKQLKDSHATTNTDTSVSRAESVDMNECDIEFEYSDCDTLRNELAELYSYSELDDFGNNIQCWKVYAENNEILPPFHFSTLPISKKTFILQDLCVRMESAEPDMRLASARIMLYILQGAYLDFSDDEEVETGVLLTATTLDKGTGDHEMDCLRNAFLNAHLAYNSGAYQALCTLLMVEVNEPFDSGPCPTSDGGRESKASSRGSRCPSSADLAEDRRNRRAATMADNEAMRTVLSALYHMVELIRNRDLAEKLSSDHSGLLSKRLVFLTELSEPLDHVGQPLLMVLFEMLHPFHSGSSPHFPIKKFQILLLIWKIILATLGGFRDLESQKACKRNSLGLSVMENTIEIASALPATVINDNESGARMAGRRIAPGHIGRFMARQLAYAGSDEVRDEEFDIGAIADDDSMEEISGTTKRPGSELRQVCSGDRTPRAGSPIPCEPPKLCLPWKSKVSRQEIEVFLQQERQKFFSYQLPGDVDTIFALPFPIHGSVEALRKHLYVSLGEVQAAEDEEYSRYFFSKKENIELNNVEKLYRLLLPNLCQYVVALLKAKNDALNILIDVLTPETEGCDVLSNSISLDHSTSSPLEESVRLAIDINRHKEIIVKSTSSILLLLMKHLRLNHIYQFEFLCQHIVYGNGIPLMLKFLDQNMMRYIQSRYEIHAYNYPQAPLHYVRNREEWPVLNAENVESWDTCRKGLYYMWRNLFSSINLIRILNKLVKGKQSRVMMLMVFKSAPILKRSLKIRLGLFQLFVLKALKMQSRYLGRQWRKSNMEIMSAIYNKVRHRMTDDWAFANEMRKSYDYHSEESELKTVVERFHSRRYSQLYSQFAVEENEAPVPGEDYLDRINLREFEPVDNCFHSVLGKQPELGKRFKNNYHKWMEEEVVKRNINWSRLLMNTRGIALSNNVTS
ncbi:n1221-like protein [Dictyocaulus viviparus]|uniref:N1221-like protein n=1 Tax=Dictyocaulus viviparus TaxID=29172 RepID=A0A0D8XDU4_DICVI|nr:n1221-like protein [Dictyocaulus viviparus]